MHIETNAPIVINNKLGKTSFDVSPADYSESGGYDFIKTEFREGVYSMDGEDMYFSQEHQQFCGMDGEYVYGADGKKVKKTKDVKLNLQKKAKKIREAGKKVGDFSKKVAASLKKFTGKFKPNKNAKPAIPLPSQEKASLKPIVSKLGGITDLAKVGAFPGLIPTKGYGVSDTAVKGQPAQKYFIPATPVIKSASGYVKSNPDGTQTKVVDTKVVTGADGNKYDSSDLNKGGLQKIITDETGKKMLGSVVDSSSIEVLTSEDGEKIPFHISDIESNSSSFFGQMPKSVKIGIVVGACVIGATIITYFIYKANKAGK